MPLLIVHGTEDTLVPVEMGHELFAAAGTNERDKTIAIIEGDVHSTLFL